MTSLERSRPRARLLLIGLWALSGCASPAARDRIDPWQPADESFRGCEGG